MPLGLSLLNIYNPLTLENNLVHSLLLLLQLFCFEFSFVIEKYVFYHCNFLCQKKSFAYLLYRSLANVTMLFCSWDHSKRTSFFDGE